MAGGRLYFLSEYSGDLVIHLRSAPAIVLSGQSLPAISNLIGIGGEARIFAEAAKLGSPMPQIVYTQVAGHISKTLSGPDGCEDLSIHIYAYAATQVGSRQLANAILHRCIGSINQQWGDGTIVHVCNGGIIDTGHHPAKDQSDRKVYWTRLALSLVIS